jgi:hypothetical protein
MRTTLRAETTSQAITPVTRIGTAGRHLNRVVTVLALAAVVLGPAMPTHAQEPNEFDRTGKQPNRDYLQLFPFERLDTQTGNVILTVPLLTLPGNAGRTLQFTLTYNSNASALGWTFGIAGMAMRVNEQATPPQDRPSL